MVQVEGGAGQGRACYLGAHGRSAGLFISQTVSRGGPDDSRLL